MGGGGGGSFCFLVWVRARSLGFRFLEASWFPWLLGFSISELLGPSTSCNLVAWCINLAFCSCMASWFPWLLGFFGFWASWPLDFFVVFLSCMACWLLGFLGFSVSRLVGLSTSYSFVYYFILCHIELYEYIYIYIILYYHYILRR